MYKNTQYKTMKTTLFTILSAFLFISVCAQERDRLDEMLANHNGIMQREGTEQLMKELLGPYGEGCDEVYAILFSPQSCPRCEVDIPFFLDNMAKAKPGARVVLVAAYPEADMAREYVKEKFGTDRLVVDSKGLNDRIFRYRYGRLSVTYVLQVDARRGRLMCGGDTPTMDMEFLRQLGSNTSYMPMAKPEDGGVSASLMSADRLPAGTYKSVRLDLGEGTEVSAICELPDWVGDRFLYSDELLSQGLLFDILGDSVAVLRQRIVPTARQERAFVHIPDSVYDDMKRNGEIFIMANGCALDPFSGQALVSYSLPLLRYREKGVITYFNEGVLLQTSSRADTCTVLPLDLANEKDRIHYMYTHASRIVPISGGRMLLGCLGGFPLVMSAEECKADAEHNIFVDAFYEEAPFCAIFDMETGRLQKRFGQLDEVFRKTHTGYFFLMPIGDCDGRRLVYTDGCSGNVWLTDKDASGQGRKLRLFDVQVPDSLLEAARKDRYTDEYFNHFLGVFHRYVDALKLDGKGIHCLIRHGKDPVKAETDSYEYRVLSEDGQVLHSVILQIEEGDELLAFMLGKDGEGRVFPYYICRNGKSCFLKRCTPSGR